MKITLNKALKLKNTKVAKITTLIQRIQQNNSFLKGNIPAYDARKLLEDYNTQVTELIKLKIAINRANVRITNKMVEMAERKSSISQIKNIDTKSGTQTGYSREAQEYQCNIAQTEKDTIVEGLEATIEKLQEEIDYYNATTEIEI